MKYRVSALAILALGLVALVGMALAQTPPASPAADEALRVFRTRCATCHGPDGRGQTASGRRFAIPDWTTTPTLSRLTDVQVATTIRTGVRDDVGNQKMPPNPQLSPEVVEALVRHVRTFSH